LTKRQRPHALPHNPRESQLHASVAQLLDWVLLPPTIYTTFPAGWGKLTKGTAGRLYASGLKKGMPDILVFDLGRKVIGIEIKVGANSVSAAQREMFSKLQGVGIRVYVCRSQEDVINALDSARIMHREVNLCQSGTNANGREDEQRTGPAATARPDTF
jgi:hypothetical protein